MDTRMIQFLNTHTHNSNKFYHMCLNTPTNQHLQKNNMMIMMVIKIKD